MAADYDKTLNPPDDNYCETHDRTYERRCPECALDLEDEYAEVPIRLALTR